MRLFLLSEKPAANVTADPSEGSDTCIGLAPSFFNLISYVLIRAVSTLSTAASCWLCVPSDMIPVI